MLETKLKNLPNQAGVYHYFDKDGRLLYIGKAKNLAKRVKSYFLFNPLRASNRLSMRITKMIQEAVSLEYIVVKNEHDALLLENSLIKQLHPKYNILLRDDKTYPYIYIDHNQTYPRVAITRKVLEAKNIEYFGPFSVGANDIVTTVYEFCKLVQKKANPKGQKVCLYHQIGRCLAPCVADIAKAEYQEELQKAVEFITNKNLLVAKLKEKMELYASELRFEEALELRERITRITKTALQSSIDFATNEQYDIFVLEQNEKKAVVVTIFMRKGKVVSSDAKTILKRENFDAKELLERTIMQFYSKEKPPVVAPILVNLQLDDEGLLCNYLSELFEKKAVLHLQQRGKKKQLIELASVNAKEILRQEQVTPKEELMREIQTLCNLEYLPLRIECFDNSHLGGKAPVGGMVVFDNGRFEKSSYRQYHLEAKDEYAQMREMLTRRVESFEKNPPPELWVIDGGATLLALAADILASVGANVDVVALAKEKIDAKAHRAKGAANDILYTKESVLRLKPSDARLQFLQRLRDEAHRFAITFHQKTKLKQDNQSKLLALKGISQPKIKKLLDYFGTFEVIKSATLEELSTILNTKDAKIIKKMYG